VPVAADVAAVNLRNQVDTCSSDLHFRIAGFIQLKREDKDMVVEKLGKGEKK